MANDNLLIAATKEAALYGPAMDLERRVAYVHSKRDFIMNTEDAKEGLKPCAQKRSPVWKGR